MQMCQDNLWLSEKDLVAGKSLVTEPTVCRDHMENSDQFVQGHANGESLLKLAVLQIRILTEVHGQKYPDKTDHICKFYLVSSWNFATTLSLVLGITGTHNKMLCAAH